MMRWVIATMQKGGHILGRLNAARSFDHCQLYGKAAASCGLLVSRVPRPGGDVLHLMPGAPDPAEA